MRLLGIGLALSQSVLLQVRAQPVAPSPAPNVKLEVRTRDNQKTFRMGEIIPLELRFSSTVQHQMDGRNYDRSGRLDLETYTVEPRSGWKDPLDLYFRTVASIGGGTGAIYALSSEPILIIAELNEWVRFEHAGEYRVTVQSSRVRGEPVVSNQVWLTIVDPTPEWQEETLKTALAALAASAPAWPFGSGVSDPGRNAIRTLRFLGTPAAAREMAHRVTDIDCVLGLAGSPARKAALDEMNRLLRDSTVVADGWITHLMSVLETPQNEDENRH